MVSQDMETTSKELDIKDEWWLVHRNDLHQEMLATANRGFNGRKPKIYLSTGVESVVSKSVLLGCTQPS
jgi:hypothetical protein